MTKVPALRAILLQPLQEKKVLRFRLVFLPKPIHHPPIEFELSRQDAMGLLSALQAQQRLHGWHIPHHRGKPNLSVVGDEG